VNDPHFGPHPLVQIARDLALPGVACLNSALVQFEPKVVFRWHLSVLVDLEDLIDDSIPSEAERELIEPFVEGLDQQFKGAYLSKPNALFLARITWKANRELIYRVYDPEPIDARLQKIISLGEHPRPFDYRMVDDPEWALAEWHLKSATA